jgi:hypothetical protein
MRIKKYNVLKNNQLNTEENFHNLAHANKTKNISKRNYHEFQEKEDDLEEIKDELRNLDVKKYFVTENNDEEESEVEDDDSIYDDYEYDGLFILDNKDPQFDEKLHDRIGNDKLSLMTPETVEKHIKLFLGQSERLKQKARISIRIYKMVWNTVRRTVKVLKNCEIKKLDVYYYEDVFTKKDFLDKPLDIDDPFYPFYIFVKNFVNYEFKKEDFNEVSSFNYLSDQPFISFLVDSFKTLTRTYKDSIDKKQKIVIDITNDTKKEITDDQKRFIHNLLFKHIQSIRKMFNFSNCHDSFRSQLMEIDELIDQSFEKIDYLNTRQDSNIRILKGKMNDDDIPEINYKPGVIKNKEKCKEMVFKKSIKEVDKEAFDCINLPVKKDKDIFSDEEYESEHYLYDDSEILLEELPVIKDKYNNDKKYNIFSNINSKLRLFGQLKQPVLVENVKRTHLADSNTDIASLNFCNSSYVMISFLFIMLAIYIGFIVKKTIRKRYKKQNKQYLICHDEVELPIEEVINIKEERNGRV